MAALKHDAQGFLQGDPVQLEGLLKSSQAMAKDIRAIRGILEGSKAGARAAGGGATPRAKLTDVALPVVAATAYRAANDSRRDPAAAQREPAAAAKAPAAPAPAAAIRPGMADSAKPAANGEGGTAAAEAVKQAAKAMGDAVAKAAPQRGANGRFARRGGAAGAGAGAGAGGGGGEDDQAHGQGVFARLADAIKSAGDAEEADPAIKAMNEIARPMARGYELLSGDKKERKQERWYRRFWMQMRGKDELDAKNNKLTQRGITALIEKPTGDGKGRGGFLPMLLAGLKGMLLAIFGRFLPKALLGAGLAGAGGALPGMGGGGGRAPDGKGPQGKGGAADKPGKPGKLAGVKGALKRIPLLGTALALLGGAGAVMSSESSDMSRKEKDKATGSAVGGTAGTLGGMLGGAKLGAAIGALGGPIGIAIGGVVGGAAGAFFGDKAGQVIGETVGGWVTTLREADLPGKFMAGVDSMREGFSKAMSALAAGWEAGVGYLKEVKDSAVNFLKDKANAANEAIKSATGIDLKAGAQKVVAVAGKAASKAGEAVKSVAGTAGEAAKGAVNTAGEVAKSAASATGQAIQQSTVGKGVTAVASAVKNEWKSGDRKNALIAEMDSQGITNKNERAMLMAQVDHESNGFRAGEESFNYRSADRIAAVSKSAGKHGKPAIEAAMKQGPEAVAELMYGGRMGNKDPGDGYKFRGRGSIQITGRDNYKKLGEKLGLDLENNPDLLQDPAIAAKASVQWWKDSGAGTKARAGDVKGTTQIVNGGQNGFEHRNELFAKYSNDPVANYSGGAVQAAQVNPAPAVAGTVSAHASVMPTKVAPSPAANAVAAAPAVPAAVASAGAGRGAASMPTTDPGQDLSDRRLAHVATGGIGGAA